MPENKCIDCGVFLQPHTEICPACGVRNCFEAAPDVKTPDEYSMSAYDNQVPENYPGY